MGKLTAYEFDKKYYQEQWETIKDLDTKSMNLAGMAGGLQILSLIPLIISLSGPAHQQKVVFGILYILISVFLLASVLIALWAHNVRKYESWMTGEEFEKTKKTKDSELHLRKVVRHNQPILDERAKLVTLSTYGLGLAIFCSFVLVVATLFAGL